MTYQPKATKINYNKLIKSNNNDISWPSFAITGKWVDSLRVTGKSYNSCDSLNLF